VAQLAKLGANGKLPIRESNRMVDKAFLCFTVVLFVMYNSEFRLEVCNIPKFTKFGLDTIMTLNLSMKLLSISCCKD
jgi:hypothetical protein